MKLFVKVKARAKEERVVRVDDTHFKVWVKAVPEKGKANEAVIAALSAHFVAPKATFDILSGHTSNQKVIEKANVSPWDVVR